MFDSVSCRFFSVGKYDVIDSIEVNHCCGRTFVRIDDANLFSHVCKVVIKSESRANGITIGIKMPQKHYILRLLNQFAESIRLFFLKIHKSSLYKTDYKLAKIRIFFEQSIVFRAEFFESIVGIKNHYTAHLSLRSVFRTFRLGFWLGFIGF